MGDDAADERVEEAPQYGPGAHRVTLTGRVGPAGPAPARRRTRGPRRRRAPGPGRPRRGCAAPPGTEGRARAPARRLAGHRRSRPWRCARRRRPCAHPAREAPTAARCRRCGGRRRSGGCHRGAAGRAASVEWRLPDLRGELDCGPGGRLGRPGTLERQERMGAQPVTPLVGRVGGHGPVGRGQHPVRGGRPVMAPRQQAQRLGVIGGPADGGAAAPPAPGPPTDLEQRPGLCRATSLRPPSIEALLSSYASRLPIVNAGAAVSIKS